MKIGSIVFGPVPAKPVDGKYLGSLQGGAIGVHADMTSMACNCMGPQPGQTKCPCALRRESEMGERMVSEGVVVNGRRYKLVHDPQ